MGHQQLSRGCRAAFFLARPRWPHSASRVSRPSRATAQDGDQAEWPQSYEASPHMAVGRESTPILSPATVEATEQAIQNYQNIVAKGGWGQVPPGADLKIGSKGPRVQALRDRLVVSGDLDPIAGAGATYDFFVEAAVKRFQARHGLSETGVVNEADVRRTERAGRGAPAAARDQHRAAQGLFRRSRRTVRGRQHTVGVGRDRRERRRLFPSRRRRRQDRPPVADHADACDRR